MSKWKCVFIIVLLAVVANAQSKSATLKIKPYTFENSKGEKTPAEFGTLLVPENRNNKDTRRLDSHQGICRRHAI